MIRPLLLLSIALASGCTQECDPKDLAACRDSLASARADLRCAITAIPAERWYHVIGTTLAAYPDTGECGIVYYNTVTGEASVVRE